MNIKWAESVGKESDGWILWPTASYADGQPAAYVACGTSYNRALVALKLHGPLTLYVGDYRQGALTWRRVGRPFSSMVDVKAALTELLDKHSEFLPAKVAKPRIDR
jgi:hypothetical protein